MENAGTASHAKPSLPDKMARGGPLSEASLQLVFRGVRGSVPTPDPRNLGYGGNTTCLDLARGSWRRLLIDCGTGLRSIEHELTETAPDGFDFEVLLTHYHSDHLIGLPFFKPLYDARNRFTFYGTGWEDSGVQAALEGTIRPPWFPISLRDTPCAKRYVELGPEPIDSGGLRITHARLNHPQGVTAYRLERGGRSVVFATDHERGDPECDARLQALAAGASVLIHDAQYVPAEYEARHRGWGHSTWLHAVEAARAAGAARLILFHHDPDRPDDAVAKIVEQARVLFPAVDAAREGMRIEI